MYDSEIFKLINRQPHMKKHFKGFYARDTLPPFTSSDLQHTFCIIINTDLVGEAGEHWILFYWDSKLKLAHFLDPLAQPLQEEFQKWMQCCNTIVLLSHPVQHHLSVLCGLFVLYFMYYLCAGQAISDIVNRFSNTKLRLNDQLVSHFAKQKLLYTPPLYKQDRKHVTRKNVADWMSRKSIDLWLHKER